MKKFVIAVILALMVCINPAFAAKDRKGASDEAYEHANENAVFNQVGDWFATVGKSDEEKERIKAQRKAERKVKHAEKKAKKMMEEGKEEGEKKMKKMDKEWKKEKKSSKEWKGSGKKGH